MLQPAAHGKLEKAHGHALRTLNGRVVSIERPPPPKNVAIVEWDSLDDAVAFYKSEAWTDLAPQREFHLTGSDRYSRFRVSNFAQSPSIER